LLRRSARVELRQWLPDDRGGAADGAASEIGGGTKFVGGRLGVLGHPLRRCGGRTRTVHEERAGDFKPGRRMAFGHQVEVPDLHEAVRQHVLEKSAEKGVRREGDGLAALGAEGDPALVHRHEAMVGDADAMGVPIEISNHLLGAAEEALGIDSGAL
jgi:hypothetical protein